MATAERVHIVVACTNRKTRPVPPGLRLGRVSGAPLEKRADRWIECLSTIPSDRRPALGMYAGEAWDAVRSVANTSSTPVSLWICSAGLGLIGGDTEIPPYSATFEASHPDGLPKGADAPARWWKRLGQWSGPGNGPRSLCQLAEGEPSGRFFVVLSPTYLKAVRADLVASLSVLESRENLTLLSVGTKDDPELADRLLPADARLRHKVGGTMHALNYRVMAALLARGELSHHAMVRRVRSWLAAQPPLPTYDRRPVDDVEVRTFIRGHLRSPEAPSCTSLLRELRNSGRACEQGRFSRLYHEEKKQHASCG
jgi:hypothetical protein